MGGEDGGRVSWEDSGRLVDEDGRRGCGGWWEMVVGEITLLPQ